MAVFLFFHWRQSAATVAVGETISVPITADDVPNASKLSAAVSPNAVVESTTGTSVTFRGVSAGTKTIPAGTDVSNSARDDFYTDGAFTLTVTAPVDDESYLNKRGLTHFWENIDEMKQDKMSSITNARIDEITGVA